MNQIASTCTACMTTEAFSPIGGVSEPALPLCSHSPRPVQQPASQLEGTGLEDAHEPARQDGQSARRPCAEQHHWPADEASTVDQRAVEDERDAQDCEPHTFRQLVLL